MNEQKKWVKYNVFAVVVITILVCISNYPLLRFRAVMISDAVNGSLPIISFISDSLKHFSLPLWNPMLYYGYPEYSQLGCPNMWYPVVFLLSVFAKNMVQIINLNYIIHRILAGYFMYSFVKYLIIEKNKESRQNKENNCISIIFFISLVCGVFYSYSGFFISNAQHDIILISAVWLPFILKYITKYLRYKKFIDFFFTIFGLSMTLIGGYPGLFIIYFVILFFLIVFEINAKIYSKKVLMIKNILLILKESILSYMFIGIGTILLSAVSVIPFISNMSGITRGSLADTTIFVNQLSPIAILSMFVPSACNFIPLIDPSMISCYTGLLIIFLVPFIVKSNDKISKFYAIISLISVLMCFGDNTILYKLSLKIMPLLRFQRFPSLWRIPFSAFLIAASGIILFEISKNIEEYKKSCRSYMKYIFMGIFICIACYSLILDGGSFKDKVSYNVLNGIVITLILFILYGKLIENIHKFSSKIFILFIVVFETISFNNNMFYGTVAGGNQADINYITSGAENRKSTASYENNTNLSNKYVAERIPFYSNREIIYSKSLDEEGYSPYIMKDSYDVNSYYYRYKLLEKPVFFLTDNTVSKSKSDEVMKNADLSNDIIFTDKTSDNVSDVANSTVSVKSVIRTINSNDVKTANNSEVDINANLGVYRGNKDSLYALYFENDASDIKPEFEYISDNGSIIENGVIGFHTTIKGYVDFENTKHYIIIPQKNGVKYIRFNTNGNNMKIKNVKIVELNREEQDTNIKVNEFENNDIKLTVNSDKTQYLVALQAFHKDWKAYDNGKKIDISKTNDNFRSIKISSGIHKIEFKFEPVDFYFGFVITCISYAAGIALIFLELKGKFKFIL